jgi:hypothetical protein
VFCTWVLAAVRNNFTLSNQQIEKFKYKITKGVVANVIFAGAFAVQGINL